MSYDQTRLGNDLYRFSTFELSWLYLWKYAKPTTQIRWLVTRTSAGLTLKSKVVFYVRVIFVPAHPQQPLFYPEIMLRFDPTIT